MSGFRDRDGPPLQDRFFPSHERLPLSQDQRRPSSRDSDQSFGHDTIVVPEQFVGKSLVKYVGTLTKYFFNTTGNHTAFLDSKIFLPLDICSPLVSAGIFRVSERFEVDANWNPKKLNWIASRIVPVEQNRFGPPDQFSARISPRNHQSQFDEASALQGGAAHSSWEHTGMAPSRIIIPEQHIVRNGQHGPRDDMRSGSEYRSSHWEQSVIRAYLDRSRPFDFQMR